jgi:DHA2 family methylenomycin A resistance protein-like MFS transporter
MDVTDSDTASPTHPRASRVWTALVIFAVSLGFVMAMLDVTVVNVALAEIHAEFHTPLSALVWIIDAYTLTFAALLLLGGALADRIGAKPTYMVGLIWFIVASALCGSARSGTFLIYARLLQGAGAALFMPSSLSLLTESFPDKATRTRLLGLWGAIIATAAGAGPMVGGVLVSQFGWRSIFYLNLPIGILGAILTLLVLRRSPRKRHPFDFPTHGLIMATLAGLSFVMIEGPALGWLSPKIIAAALAAVAAVAGVVLRERTARHPVIPQALARNIRFWALNGMGFMVNVVMFGEIFVISLFLQKAQGASALATGLEMFPMMCLLSVMNVMSGFLAVRWNIQTVIVLGLGGAAAGAAVTAVFGGHGGFWLLASSVGLCNGGLGLAIPAMMNGVMHEAGKGDANVGAATLNANRQIGALTGVAAVGIVLHLITDWNTDVSIVFSGFTVCLLAALALVRHVFRNADA